MWGTVFHSVIKLLELRKVRIASPLGIKKLEENDIAWCPKISSEVSAFLCKGKIHTRFHFEMRFHSRYFKSNSQQQQK